MRCIWCTSDFKKLFSKHRIKRNYLNLIKGIYEIPTAMVIFKDDRINMFPLRKNKTKILALTTFIQPGAGEWN